ncbi:MAG TPA: hypothetical protein DCQ37_14195 [Desulfobacteraceae bacterium]|nr:hypothetical protein [Desulfobacteraceae bacterium]
MNDEKNTEQSSVSIGQDLSDSVVIAGKDNITNINITNITQLPPQEDDSTSKEKRKSRKFIYFICVCIIMLVLSGLSGWLLTRDIFQPFPIGTYGVIISPFSSDTDAQKNKGKEIQGTIQSTLNVRFKEWGINDAQAMRTSKLIKSHEQARAFGKKYRAELVIWGYITLQGVIPNLTIVHPEDAVSNVISPEMTILKDSLCHAALATERDIRLPALTDEPGKLVSFVTGLKYYNQKHYPKSIEYFTYALPEITTKYIDNSRIFFFRAKAQYYLKDYDKAIADYNKAIELNPNLDSAYNNRGFIYDENGDYDKAIADYNKAIELNPNLDAAYNNRGSSYGKKGDYAKAFDDYNKSIRINNKNDSAFLNRGNIYYKQGDYDKAIEDYTKAIQLNSRNDSAYNNLAGLLATCADAKYRNGARAVEFAKKATELSPNNFEISDTLAAAYAQAGRFEDAVKTQEKAIEMLNEKDKTLYLIEFTERLNLYKARKPWQDR